MVTQKHRQITDKLILEAETLFGNRIEDWNFYGIEFNDQQPSLKYYIETGHVTISLSLKAIADDLQFIFQVSHEVCHLLHPSREYPSLYENQSLVINEGISTYFSVLKTNEYFNNEELIIENLRIHSPKYYKAYVLVKKLLDLHPNAIKELRIHSPRIDKIKEIDFDKLNVNIPNSIQTGLLEAF